MIPLCLRGALVPALAALLAAQSPVARSGPQPIDLAAIDRTVAKTPKLTSHARYGLFLFGKDGEKRVWAILDSSNAAADPPCYDVLYLDRNADGDLTGEGETLRAGDKEGVFAIGDFKDPGTGAVHKDFTITWTEASVRFRMLWRGTKVTFGGYGPTRETYAQFAKTPAMAPVFVPGWDRPLEFEHWMSGTLKRGESTDFKVFVGNRGDRRGAYSAVDDKFLPAGVVPDATLIWTDADGKERRTKFPLPERC
jgi:hypothetical protein